MSAVLHTAGDPYAALDEASVSFAGIGQEADRVARRAYLVVKRGLDLTIAATLLLALSWLLVIVALAVKCSTAGPIFFRQARVGRYGQTFTMVKFRTMHAERRQRRLPLPAGITDRRSRHKGPADPRVTALGRILRRTCLDELPQLWNVLLGDMSLVGPRPELPEIVASYQPWQHARHMVTPGITGWWQVNRNPGQLMHHATELDLHYVRNQSLPLDLWILVRTVGAVIGGSGAF